MNNTMRLQAETAARLLLQYYRSTHPDWTDDKTPVDELLAWLGLHVATFHPDDYPQGTYGFIDPDEDENLIWLCRSLPETLHRFTLAHELGHMILHCQGGHRFQQLIQHFSTQSELITPTTLASMQPSISNLFNLSPRDPCSDIDVQADMLGNLDEEYVQEILGLGHSYDPRSQRELAANFFAAELLLPCERVRTLYLEEHSSPQLLATLFGVSPAALLNRLAGLLNTPASTAAPMQSAKPTPPLAAKKHYDKFQQAAIQTSTPALIIAGPGSGKTSTLIGRIEYLMRTCNIEPKHILALTFSRKATQEMEDRLRQVLAGETPLIPKVSTFHAFCADLLRRYAPLAGLRTDFGLVDEVEGYFLLHQLANNLRLHHYQQLWSPTHYFPDILKAIARAKDELVSPADYTVLAQNMLKQSHDEDGQEKAEKALEIAHIYTLYEEELKHRGDTDFGGLLTLTLQVFREHPEVLRIQQQQYQHILVDEFQDMNRASGVLLHKLAGTEQRVWVVGDANQAIYAFRGASPANLAQFEQDFPGAHVLPLSRNYRSRPDLVAIAESFRSQHLEQPLGPAEELRKNQAVRLSDAEANITLAHAADEASEITGILQDIRAKHASGYAYQDMVILCRRRAQVQKIATIVGQAGFPIIEQGSTLEQAYIKDILAILLLLVDPTGMGLLRAARQAAHPFTQQDIEALLLTAHQSGVEPRQLLIAEAASRTMSTEGRHALIRLSQILQTLLCSPDIWSLLAHYLLIETTLIRDLLVSPANKQRNRMLADYGRLLQLARHFDQQQIAHANRQQQTAREQNQASTLLSPLEERIKGFMEYLTLLVVLRQDGGNRQGSDGENEEHTDVIRVMTVHASKGLEFPIVYMPELVQQRFPFRSLPNAVDVPTGMLSAVSGGEESSHATSEACLFYVGTTRARDHLILSYSDRYGKKAYKRSLYLEALETGIPAERMSRLHWDATTLDMAPASHLPLPTDTDAGFSPAVLDQQPSADGISHAFINAMRSPALSSSAIEAYQRCPRQYAYDAIYHFTRDPNAYQLFRTATRKTLAELHEHSQGCNTSNASQRRIPTQQESQQLYTRHWQALDGHTTPFATLYEQHGYHVIEAIWHQLVAQEDINWDLQRDVRIDIAGTPIRVIIDRIETAHQTNTPIKFVRTRFGKSKEKPTAGTRELLYTLAFRQHHPGQSVELHSHNMSTGEMTSMKLTQKKEQSLYESVEQAIKGLQQNHYPAQPAQPLRCPSCPFFWICPV